MTPEELQEALAALSKKNEELVSAKEASDKKVADLADENSTLKKEKKAIEPVTFEVTKGGTSGKGHEYEAGTYEFTCPKFTWDNGDEIDVRAMANSTDEKERNKLVEMANELVMRNSGIVRLQTKD